MRVPNWIGDIVMLTPALAALRTRWPDAHVVAAGPPHAGPLLAGTRLVDEVVALPQRRGTGLAGLRAAAARLAALRCDSALLFTNSFSSALVVALAGVPRRAGHAGSLRAPLLTTALPRASESGRHRSPTPMVEYDFRLVEAVGAPRGDHRTRLATSADDERRADAFLSAAAARGAWGDAVATVEPGAAPRARGPLVGMHPGSSFGPSKLWDPARFAAVADRLRERFDARVVVFCGPAEHGLARAIAAAARAPLATAADDPLDLGALKAVVRRLDLLVSTDTGPRHFGPAFDVPTVALLGPTDPRFTNTNLHGTLVVRAEGVECSPCQLATCPLDHRCMTRLLPEQVVAAAARLLAVR